MQSFDQLPLETQRKLHELGWQFEDAWDSDKSPHLEDWLLSDNELDPSLVFRELLSIELEIRQARLGSADSTDPNGTRFEKTVPFYAEVTNAADYIERFPQYKAIIEQVFDEVNRGATVPEIDPHAAVAEDFSSANTRYHFIEEIARGGAGAIWRVLDRHLQREAAVKVLLDSRDNSEMRRRLEREARLCARMQHPGIVPIHELHYFGDGRPFVSMKLICGTTLSHLMRQNGGIPLRRAIHIFQEVCDAVAYAHDLGIIHRDLKPQNIMVDKFGGVHVLDWGLGREINSPEDADTAISFTSHTLSFRTDQGSIFGTIAYMPPEQARGDINGIDKRSDVFALGAILCEILTGQTPYASHDSAHRLDAAKQGLLDACHSLLKNSKRKRKLVQLACQCLAKDQQNRPADAREVANRIAAIQPAMHKPLYGRMLVALAGILLVLNLTAFGVYSYWERQSTFANTDQFPLIVSSPARPLDLTVGMEHMRRYIEKGQIEAAGTLAQELRTRYDNTELDLAYADILLTEKRPKDAQSIVEKLAAKSPNDPQLQLMLAQIYADTGQTESLLATTRGLLLRDPTNIRLRENHLNSLLSCNRLADDLVDFRALLGQAPTNSYLRYKAAQVLYETGRFTEGIFYLRQARSLEPTNPAPGYQLAIGLMEEGRHSEALQVVHIFSQEKSLPSEWIERFDNLLLRCEHAANVEGLIDDAKINQSLQIPDRDSYIAALLHRQRGNRTEALTELRRAIACAHICQLNTSRCYVVGNFAFDVLNDPQSASTQRCLACEVYLDLLSHVHERQANVEQNDSVMKQKIAELWKTLLSKGFAQGVESITADTSVDELTKSKLTTVLARLNDLLKGLE